ncbi:MAG: helix-turn-helix transcriptional regulator [Candidatus Omnitrophota bacterium]|nr:helix-turn-helix transcriptional regulator [Candidatus Omnitrophota bacterium]
MNMERVDEHLKEKLKDPYFKELYELEEQKLDIVKRIIDYRIKSKLTQGQLAKKAGVTQQHISKIENGDFRSIVTLEKILLFIGYTVKIQAVPLSHRVKNGIERFVRNKHRLQFA